MEGFDRSAFLKEKHRYIKVNYYVMTVPHSRNGQTEGSPNMGTGKKK